MPLKRLAASAFLLCLLSACGGNHSNDDDASTRTPLSKLALKTFSADCGDFLDYAADALTEQYLTAFYCFGDGLCPVFAAGPELATDGGAPPAPTPDRVSGTNTQEAGVDEADIVKADSEGRLYVLAGRTFVGLAAYPPQGLDARPLTTLDLAAADDSFYGSDFFLDEANARAVILGSRYDENGSEAVAVIVDVSDPAHFVERARLSVDGYGYDARRIGTRVHRIGGHYIKAPAWFYDGSDALQTQRAAYRDAVAKGDQDEADAIRAAIRDEIGQRVDATGAATFLPRQRYAVPGEAPVETVLGCDAVSHPDVTTALGLMTVDSFDTDGSNRALAAIVNNAYVVYASTRNLYLAQSSWGWWFDPAQTEETALYRFALSDDGAASYRAMAKVDGTILGAYSLSEYQDHLRVVTTERRVENDRMTPYNHVTTLRTDVAGTMPEAGRLRDLAPGETVQGVRYDGPRGFVVTFRNVDPLFAIDLSDAGHPAVMDELKIPGFSSYLMPLGQGHLLTVGRSGNDEALDGRLGIQLFDVADLADIRQVAAIAPTAGNDGYSWSVSEYDPHAFTYFPDRSDAATPGTLSIPMQAYGNGDSSESFSGFVVVRVDPDATEPLREIGRVSHAALAEDADVCGGSSRDGPCYEAIYFTEPRRSVFMQDEAGTTLFTLSSMGLIASDAAAPATQLGARALPHDWVCCHALPAGGGPSRPVASAP